MGMKILRDIFRFKQPVQRDIPGTELGANNITAGGDINQSFENDDGSLHSFGSITRILKKDKKTLKRMKTLSTWEFEKKSRNEMTLALFLYTFECISVTAFSALMFQFYHFEKYREYLKQFVKQFFSFVPFIESYYGVIGLMCTSVIVVVILSSILIITYYKKLHPRLNMFTVYSEASKSMVSESINSVGFVLQNTSSFSEEDSVQENENEQRTLPEENQDDSPSEYFV